MDEPKREVDSVTLYYLIYLFYKTSILTRHNLSHLFKIIKEPMPVDIVKYLVEEESKKG